LKKETFSHALGIQFMVGEKRGVGGKSVVCLKCMSNVARSCLLNFHHKRNISQRRSKIALSPAVILFQFLFFLLLSENFAKEAQAHPLPLKRS
jgi:hypothetical protein